MAKKKFSDIDEIIKQKWLVEFNRKPLEEKSLFGFILAHNEKFTLIQRFDVSFFCLDGYQVFQNDSIKSYSVYDDEDYFLCEVIHFKKIKPKPITNISIKNWAEILQSVSDNFSLIVIEQEEIDNEACYVGILEKLNADSFDLEEIDASAEYYGLSNYKFDNLTKVGFDGQYENTLAFVIENRYENK